MVDLYARAEAASTERERKADQVVRIDQVVGAGAEVELREDAANDIELYAFVRRRSAPTDQTETVSQPVTRWWCPGQTGRRVIGTCRAADSRTNGLPW
ncbi:MAG: hypothetical protein ACREA0_34925, partial [bacterium]